MGDGLDDSDKKNSYNLLKLNILANVFKLK